MRQFVARFPVLSFMALTLGYQVAVMGFIAWRAGSGAHLEEDEGVHMVFRLRLFGPLIFAMLITWYVEGRTGLATLFNGFKNWRVPMRWYALAFSWKFLFTWCGIAALALLGWRHWPGFFIDGLWGGEWATLKNLLRAFPFIVAIAFVEETSWMKFSATRLQDRYPAAVACLFTGIGWALWYMPMLLVGEGVPDGYPVPVFMLSMVALAFLLGWAYNMTHSGVVLLIMQIVSNCAFFLLPVLPGLHEMDAAYVNSFVAVNVLSAVTLVLVYGWRELGRGKRATWSAALAEAQRMEQAADLRNAA
ncbi:MAG: hypothetical protein KBH07_00365 [Flavobacteriales bacterium]|nr:hypothetical protein [Flavobacteriales bacterium]MBP9079507.1 hypothetical protein [Flavobacteriales bacterium]